MALVDMYKQIWSDRTLVAFNEKVVFGAPAIINRNYEGDAKRGGKVVISTLGDFVLDNYSASLGNMTSSALDVTTQTLNIDQQFYFDKRVSDITKIWGDADLFEKLVNRGSDAFVKNVESYVASLHSSFTYSGSAGVDTASAYVYDQVANAATSLMNNGVPVQSGECFVIVPPVAATAMAKDSRFTNHIEYLQNGMIDGGKVNNLHVYVSANAPTSGSGGYWYIAGHPEAWALATAIETVRVIPNPSDFGDLFQGLLVYGAKIVNQKGLYKFGVKIV